MLITSHCALPLTPAAALRPPPPCSMELSKSTGAPLPPAPAAAPKASSASVSRSAEASLGADGSEHASGHDEDGGLCHPLMPAGMGVVALDPLAMMPTADLLSFAF